MSESKLTPAKCLSCNQDGFEEYMQLGLCDECFDIELCKDMDNHFIQTIGKELEAE